MEIPLDKNCSDYKSGKELPCEVCTLLLELSQKMKKVIVINPGNCILIGCIRCRQDTRLK